MTDDDPHTQKLREQIREELGPKKRLAAPFRLLIAFGIISPFLLYVAAIWHAHHFHDYGDLLHWLMGCLTSRCAE